MSDAQITPEECYAAVVEALLGSRPGVSAGAPGERGFGASALKVNGKIFAMQDSRQAFVVKLPRRRVDDLIASGQGQPFDAGKGRPMKEWVTIPLSAAEGWTALAQEALAFVDSSALERSG